MFSKDLLWAFGLGGMFLLAAVSLIRGSVDWSKNRRKLVPNPEATSDKEKPAEEAKPSE